MENIYDVFNWLHLLCILGWVPQFWFFVFVPISWVYQQASLELWRWNISSIRLFFFFAEIFRSFFAETFRSFVSELYQNLPQQCSFASISDILTEMTFFRSFQKRFGLWPKKSRIRLCFSHHMSTKSPICIPSLTALSVDDPEPRFQQNWKYVNSCSSYNVNILTAKIHKGQPFTCARLCFLLRKSDVGCKLAVPIAG